MAKEAAVWLLLLLLLPQDTGYASDSAFVGLLTKCADNFFYFEALKMRHLILLLRQQQLPPSSEIPSTFSGLKTIRRFEGVDPLPIYPKI